MLFKSALIVAFIFICWDIWFTKIGVWWFNDRYVIGWKILNLPIEEILFLFLHSFFLCIHLFLP
ncbi:lycopene cyclase domain-containing protein [Chryseobacterium indoltheticum]|uniref:lycopene cyclase domain-containing protein n=1 Tax=Chryseobacterium indoltheticum TaxID=254 RepID=UPI003F497601